MNSMYGPWATAASDNTFHRAAASAFWRKRLSRLADPIPTGHVRRWHIIVILAVSLGVVFAPTLRSMAVADVHDDIGTPRSPSPEAGLVDDQAISRIIGRSAKTDREKHVERMILLRGTEAIRRAATIRPAWGDSAGGLQVGIATSNAKARVADGGQLSLKFYIRNVSSDTIRVAVDIIGWPFDFERNVPDVVNDDGGIANVTGQAAWPAFIRTEETFQPDEVVIVAHPGLWVSSAPDGLKIVDPTTGFPSDLAEGYPFIATVAPGSFKLSQSVMIERIAVNGSENSKPFQLKTGQLEFHVVLGEEQPAEPARQRSAMPTTELHSLMARPAVQAELKVTDKQKEAFKELTAENNRQQTDLRRLRKVNASEYVKKRRDVHTQRNGNLKEILDDEQWVRIQQIQIQLVSRSSLDRALSKPYAIEKLKLTDDQVRRLREVTLAGTQGGPRLTREQSQKKALEILTDEQKKQWESEKGEPFDLSKLRSAEGADK